jgi:hypothetical protein
MDRTLNITSVDVFIKRETFPHRGNKNTFSIMYTASPFVQLGLHSREKPRDDSLKNIFTFV